MTRRTGRVLGCLAGLIALCGPVASQGADLEGMFPGLAIDHASSTVGADLRTTFRSVVFGLPAGRAYAESVVLANRPEGMFLEIPRVVFRPTDDTHEVAVSDLNVLMSAPLDGSAWGGDPACGHVEAIEKIRIGSVEVRRLSGGTYSPSGLLRAEDVEMLQSSDREPCTLTGSGGAGRLVIDTPETGYISLTGLSLDLEVPLSGGAAATHPGVASVSAGTRRIEHMTPQGLSSVGVTDLNIRASSAARAMAPLVHVVSNLASGRSTGSRASDLVQVWNALHLSGLRFEVSSGRTRISLPGIVPREWVFNFARADLTTLLASLDIAGRFGQAGFLSAQVDLNGVFTSRTQIEGATRPIPASLVVGMETSEDILSSGLAVLDIAQARVHYSDTGLNGIAMDVFGVPAGRYLEGLAGIVAQGDGDGEPSALQGGLKMLAKIFRASLFFEEVIVRVRKEVLPMQVSTDLMAHEAFLDTISRSIEIETRDP